MQLDIHCEKHPRYKALKAPRVNCDACFILFCLNTGTSALGVAGNEKNVGVQQVGLLMIDSTPRSGILVAK